MLKDGANLGELIIKSLDIITITVPPALATCMSIGAEIATERYISKKIY
jgi:cation-transporting ATPase 13A2